MENMRRRAKLRAEIKLRLMAPKESPNVGLLRHSSPKKGWQQLWMARCGGNTVKVRVKTNSDRSSFSR